MFKFVLVLIFSFSLVSCSSGQTEIEESDSSCTKVSTVQCFFDSLGYQTSSVEIPQEFILISNQEFSYISFPPFKEGYIDSNGWKQGMHKGYSGSWLFERTYINDTLNGPFRKYTAEGTTLTLGFYKNHKQDGIWIEYYFDGQVEKIEHFEAGLLQGPSKHFYKGGQLNYQALFNADTLVGKAISYYENGEIKAEGNKRNGEWITYHKNGKIASRENTQNGSLFGERIMYNENGEQILPIFQEQIGSDSNVINTTKLKVHVMFEQPKSTDQVLIFGESLFWRPKIVSNEKGIILQYGLNQIIIKDTGVDLKYSSENPKGTEIESIIYGTNRRAIEMGNGDVDVEYIQKDVVHHTNLGELIVHIQQLQCDDTGSNPITLETSEGIVEIHNIHNLLFFEHDLNNDGNKELYILSYASCEGYLKIYKIEP